MPQLHGVMCDTMRCAVCKKRIDKKVRLELLTYSSSLGGADGSWKADCGLKMDSCGYMQLCMNAQLHEL